MADLIVHYSVSGRQVHDAHLVASMLVNAITHILTFNGKDFMRYAAWEHTPRQEKECLIHYNLCCVRARISYSSHSPVKEIKVDQAMEALETAARLGLLRETTITGDMDKEDGDLYPLLKTGPDQIQKRIHELRPKLWRNEGRIIPPQPSRFRRAWDVLWNP